MALYVPKDKKFTLLGLTSYGGKCSDGSPGVYVRLTYYLKWISGKTGLKF
jgi:secreted trypsin-like serine protease